MSISIKNVCKTYGTQKVLDHVNFEIRSGEIVGFIGPNGAGKSTTMKCITGFIPYDSGSIKICEKEVRSYPIETKRLIGYLPEHNPLYLEMYVKEYLTFIGKMYGLGNKTKSRVDEMIEQTGLTKEFHKQIGQLSKGYRQRVGLAQALIHDPQILILDEPTTGLDPNQLVDVRNLISEIGKKKTVMLSTHIMQEVSAICDRVIIINHGKIVADQSEKEILTTGINHKYILSVEIEEINVSTTIFSAIAGIENVQKTGENTFEIESSLDIRKEVSKTIIEKNLTLLTLNLQKRDMTEVFHEITQK